MSHQQSIQEENKKIFLSLATNAFDFFERSVDEFEKEPKYAIIHFCVAVETLLKARLMTEHWSLIAQKSDEINRKNFLEGDFKSVTIDTCINRLNSIACVNISDNAKNSFSAISKERNKIVHFYNENILSNKIKESLANKMYVAWFFICKLLDEWKSYFIDFCFKIQDIQKKMISYEKYLKERYKRIHEELLSKLDKSIYAINICDSCQCKSMIYKLEQEEYFLYGTCAVCDARMFGVKIEDTDSENNFFVFDKNNTIDGNGKDINIKDMLLSLEKDKNFNIMYKLERVFEYSSSVNKEGYQYWRANCTNCDGSMTAIMLPNDTWYCIECGESFSNVSVCEWCNEQYTGEKEDTYTFGCGCSFCEGSAGWHADDKD